MLIKKTKKKRKNYNRHLLNKKIGMRVKYDKTTFHLISCDKCRTAVNATLKHTHRIENGTNREMGPHNN